MAKPKQVQQPGPAPQPRNPYMDGSGKFGPPALNAGMQFSVMGSTGLRQYSGWVREEFLPQLQGRQAARVYREMQDNSPTVSAMLFAITQTIRQVEWRLNPPDDTPASMEMVEFVESCMEDMSHTWADFTSEQLTMLPYGFAPFEIVYKRRMGDKGGTFTGPGGATQKRAPSKYKDGKVGWRKLPLRGQDTVIKWFLDSDGAITGLTQQPWIGGLIDIPIEKMLLFRPRAHKNNPEGNSILRSAYRPWYFSKRLEEQEAIMFERFCGLPIVSVPHALLEAAQGGDPNAVAMLEEYKRIGRNVRIDDQMCVVLPSDTYKDSDGKTSAVRMYDLQFAGPQSGRASISADASITRYKLDIMTCVLADFLTLGHTARGTQSLADTKVDMFFQATEGWVGSNAEVMNRFGLPRLFDMNNFDKDTMPNFAPDMPQRTDLDVLSNAILRLSQAGMPIVADPETDAYLRSAIGLPDVSEAAGAELVDVYQQKLEQAATAPPAPVPPGETGEQDPNEQIKKMIAGALGRRMVRMGYRPDLAGSGPRRPVR